MAGNGAQYRALRTEGERQGSVIWYSSGGDGFLYHKVSQPLANGDWAYTCRNRACHGRARSSHDDCNMRITTQHDLCVPDKQFVALEERKRSILEQCMTVPLRLIPITIQTAIDR